MIRNVGSLDRFFRAVIGLGLLYMPLIVHEPWALWAGLVGVIPLASAIAAYCPGYKMCGCSTCCCKDKTCSCGESKKE